MWTTVSQLPADIDLSREGLDEPMDLTQAIFPLIDNDDVSGVAALLDEHPGLVHSRRMNGDDRR